METKIDVKAKAKLLISTQKLMHLKFATMYLKSMLHESVFIGKPVCRGCPAVQTCVCNVHCCLCYKRRPSAFLTKRTRLRYGTCYEQEAHLPVILRRFADTNPAKKQLNHLQLRVSMEIFTALKALLVKKESKGINELTRIF